ncbi:MAG: DUF3106 domain-containing protein [Planctomycetota bacterium]|nr:DUF3106 domain-containing protein [Planctomycetota bacterium]
MRAVLFVLFGVVLSGLFAEDSLSESLKKWKRLSVAERRALVEAYKRFRSMPKEKQAQVVERWQRFRQLSEDEKKRCIERWKHLNSLPREKREGLVRRWQKMGEGVKNLINTLSEEKRGNFYRMPPQKRMQEERRLVRENSVRLFKRMVPYLSDEETKGLFSLSEEEFLSRVRELVAKHEESLLESLIKSLPKPMQLRLAEIPKAQRREAVEGMLRDNWKKQKDSLRAAGFNVASFEGLPFQAEVLAVFGAYRKVVRSVVDKILEAFKTVVEEPLRMRYLSALQSKDVEELPEQFRSNPEILRLFSLPQTMREEILGIVKQRLHHSRSVLEQPFLPPSSR